MKIVRNTGTDRVIDLIRPWLMPGRQLDLVAPSFSLFAFAEILAEASRLARVRLLLPSEAIDLVLLGTGADRAGRNRLQGRWLAKRCVEWLKDNVELRRVAGIVPQAAVVLRDPDARPEQALLGSFSFTTDGLGITPGNPLSLVQASETAAEAELLSTWFDAQWTALQPQAGHKQRLIDTVDALAVHRPPSLVYFLILYHLFKDIGGDLDEDRIIKSATGIRDTTVWKKLFKFQRDGVIGAIDKLERFGGCIIADSVGLGKTFEALAIIKYHELRNDRVLVLVPKRLRDNWTLYKANDRRNFLAADRFHYD
ncbi:MAG: SNF2-related protein, partial [Minicystis sp.]